MWGNLARGLKENLDVDALRETINHVADVVAPPLGSDEEYETDDEEEYEYYEEEIVLEDNEKDDAAVNNKESLGTMLQHMLDDEEEEHHRQELKEQEERYIRPTIPDDEDDDIEEEVISFESEPSPTIAANKATQDSSDSAANARVPAPEPSAKTTTESPVPPKHFPGAPVPHVHHKHEESKDRILKTEPVRVESIETPSMRTSSAQPTTTTSKTVQEPPLNHSVHHLETKPAARSLKNSERSRYNRGNDEQSNGTSQFVSPPALLSSIPGEEEANGVVRETNQVVAEDEDRSRRRTALTNTSAASMPPATTTKATDQNDEQKPPTKVPIERAAPSPPPCRGVPIPKEPLPSKQTTTETISAEDETPVPTVPPMRSSAPSPPPPAPVPLKKEAPPAEVKATSPHIVPKAPSPPLPPPRAPSPKPNSPVPPPPQPQPDVAAQHKPRTQELLKKANEVVTNSNKKKDDHSEVLKLQRRNQDLEKQLQHAELHIVELQRDAAQRMDEEEEWRASHLRNFQLEQAQMVEAATQAAAQEHERELAELRDLLQQECFALKQQLQEERDESRRQVETFQQALQEAEVRVQAMEAEKRRAESKQKSSLSQLQQQQEHAVRKAEDKLAHTLAKLDDREEEVAKLKATIKELKASTTEHREVAQEAEEEMDELHAENEALQHNLHAVEEERDELNKQLKLFESQKEKMHGLQMELRMLKEARDRERAHRENAAVDAESNQAELVAERDVALSTARDLERQLKAALADLDIAKADADRIMMANVNLQSALEAFQSERDAEMSMIEEQRAEAEQATAAAHAAAIEATRETNEARMREVQMAADAAVKNVMREVNELEAKLEDSRKENVNLRRSLDEAIQRLQTSQEDVIDRVLMKNILLDWFSKTGKGKRDVLALMASVLHFTEEEKDAIHIGDHSGTFGKIAGAVAAPLPPSAADIEHLEGDTVREKWVNFLLAETGGDDDKTTTSPPSDLPATNGDAR